MGTTKGKQHDYNFPGGNFLRRIGASYYVCYLYGINIDAKETRWQQVKTKDFRNKLIAKHTKLCSPWLEEISKMKKVGTNSMGLTTYEVHKYAEALLHKFPNIKFQ
jgi:hypothetical protein